MSKHSERIDQLSTLKGALFAVEKLRSKLESVKSWQNEPIAIIGMGCRFPGGATDPESFWHLLRDGVDTVSRIPQNRWDVDAFYDPDPDVPGKMYTREGSFLENIDGFDSAFFGISPREAVNMDPQQRLLLEVSWEAIENSGYAPDRLAGTQAGVFIGICNRDYADVYRDKVNPARIDAYAGTGNVFSVAAGRLAYTLGLHGPALAVDTACSSSLVAVHLACQSLRNRECDMALAGGVNLILSPYGYVSLSRARALSLDGRCRTFDAQANGYGRGEGCGIIVLKRISDAVAAGDQLLTIIRGTAVNHDGRSSGLTVPNGSAQKSLLGRALENAGVDPAEVSYVEAHGTGTSLGDPIEVGALAAVLGNGRPSDRPLMIGSVKTNIAHLEAAAGIAGIIKVVLSLAHEEIPRHLHLKHLNPHILREQHPIRVTTAPVPWPARNGPRIAGVSAFGLAGTNAHLLVEEPHVLVEKPCLPELVGSASSPQPQVLTLSARNDGALLALTHRFISYLAEHPDVPFDDVCYTSTVGRSHFSHRLAVVARSSAEAARKLSFSLRSQPTGTARGELPANAPPALAFLFSGEDAAYGRMARQLVDTQPVFRENLLRCDEILRSRLDRPLLALLYPEPKDCSPEDHPVYLRPALVAVNYALAKLWHSWGVAPTAVVGHGIGEYAAASFAGLMSLESALELAAQPGSSHRAVASEERTAGVGMVSGVRGAEARLISQNDDQRGCPAQTEEFFQNLQSISQAGCKLFLEISPRAVLADLARRCIIDGESTFLSSSTGDETHWQKMVENLATLYARGIPVDWSVFHGSNRHRRVPLPTYPFQREHYWIEKTSPTQSRLGALSRSEHSSDSHPLLGFRLQSPLRQVLFESRYGLEVLPWLNDHKFYESLIVAGATYLSAVIAGAVAAFKTDHCILADVAFPQPMILENRGIRVVQLILSPEDGARCSFQFVSTAEGNAEVDKDGQAKWKLHAAGRLDWSPERKSARDERNAPLPILRRQDWEDAAVEAFYKAGLECGMQAGPSFKWIKRLWRRPGEALAEMIPPPDLEAGERFEVHPGLIDSCFQLIGACLPAGIFPPPEGQIPVVAQVEHFYWKRMSHKAMWAHLHVRPFDGGEAPQRFCSDLHLFDERGSLLLEVLGLHIQLVSHRELLQRERKPLGQWMHQIEWQRATRPVLASPSSSGGSWLLFCDAIGVGRELAALLEAQGEAPVIVLAGTSFERVDQGSFRVNRSNHDDFRRLLQETASSNVPCCGIIYLWSLDLAGAEEYLGNTFEGTDVLALDSALHLVRAAVDAAWAVPPRLWLVTQGAQAVGGEDRLAPAQSPIWGFGNVVALEQPRFRCVNVDLDPDRTTGHAADLLNEILCPDREDKVAFRDNARRVPRLVPAAVAASELSHQFQANSGGEPSLFRSDATYLVTGGLGALGKTVARWMVDQGARHLILLGRNINHASLGEAIPDLEKLRGTLHVAAVDVSTYESLATVIDGIEPSLPLRGVVHAAGVLDDGTLLQLNTAQLTSVLRPKVHGGWNLHLLTRFMALDFFVLFSSAASILGSPGQANYAAANAFLDVLAHERRRQGLPALSINWGPWSGNGGMSANLGIANERRWRQSGIDFVSPSDGLEALGHLLRCKQSQMAVLPVDWERFLRRFSNEAKPPFLSLLPEVTQSPSPQRVESPHIRFPDMTKQLQRAEPSEREALLIEHLRIQAARVLGLSASDRVDPRVQLDELGLDSLMAVELRNALQETLKRSLPATLVYDYPTIAGLAEYLLKNSALEKP